MVDQGLATSIGVSNMNTQLLYDLLKYARIKPAINQIELNPQNSQAEFVAYLKSEEIVPMAYSPIGAPYHSDTKAEHPDLRTNAYLMELAAKYNKNTIQIMLNWGLCRGHVVIPGSKGLEHQKENINIFDFRLTEEEIEQINKNDSGIRGYDFASGGTNFFKSSIFI